MRKQRFWLLLRGLLLLATTSAVLAPVQAQAPEYRVVLLHDRTPPRTFYSEGHGASEGVVVGQTTPDPFNPQTTHAFLWNLTDNTTRDLHDAGTQGFDASIAWRVSGDYIVGVRYHAREQRMLPTVWDRRTGKVSPLSGLNEATTLTVSGHMAVGGGFPATQPFKLEDFDLVRLISTLGSGKPQWTKSRAVFTNSMNALVWNLKNDQRVSLQSRLPKDYVMSNAHDIWGDLVVGYAGQMRTGAALPYEHAYLWNLATGETTDLHTWVKGAYPTSFAHSVWGDRVVGMAIDKIAHAYLWDLKARTATDLHALLGGGYDWSEASTIVGTRVAGTARNTANNDLDCAVLWDLAKGTVTNLQDRYLKQAGFRQSEAMGLSSDGVVVGWGTRKGQLHAWALIPTVPTPHEVKPLPTVHIGETPRWTWLLPGTFLVIPAGIVLWRIRRRRAK